MRSSSGREWCRRHWRWRGTAPATGPTRHRGSDPGTCGSAPGRAPRAAPPRVAAPVGAQLVDLVEQDHRVHRARVPQRAHQAAGQRADVGASMPADLRLVADAAERYPDELPASRPRDRLADRRLAGPGGPIRVRIAPDRRSSVRPRSARSFRTARYSVMRRFTSSRPAWSASSTSRACFGSSRSSERFDHGTAISQSR